MIEVRAELTYPEELSHVPGIVRQPLGRIARELYSGFPVPPNSGVAVVTVVGFGQVQTDRYNRVISTLSVLTVDVGLSSCIYN